MEISVSIRNETTLAVRFLVFYKEGITRIKTIPGRRWIPNKSVWSIPYTLQAVEQLLTVFADCKIHIDGPLLEECYVLQDWFGSSVTTSST